VGRLLFHSFWGNFLIQFSKLMLHRLVLPFGHSKQYLPTTALRTFHENVKTFSNAFFVVYFGPGPPLDKIYK